MNMETMNAMKRGKDILKGIHGNLYVLLALPTPSLQSVDCADALPPRIDCDACRTFIFARVSQQYRQGRARDGGHSRADGAWSRDFSCHLESSGNGPGGEYSTGL